MSCAGNGYLSGNRLTPFPFEDGQFLRWPDPESANDAQLALQKCFVDAVVNVCSESIADSEWPSVGGFRKDGGRISFSLLALGDDVRISVVPSSVEFPIVSGRARFGWYCLTLSSEGVREMLESSFEFPDPNAEGTSALRLCCRCVSVKPDELKSIRVYDGYSIRVFDDDLSYGSGDICRHDGLFYRCITPVDAGGSFDEASWKEIDVTDADPDFTMTGDVQIHTGYNMSLDDSSNSIMDSDLTGISLNATPGAGLGTVPCDCSSSESLESALIGKDGHTRIFNDTCYDVEPKYETNKTTGKRYGVIQLHAKCTACCTCDMYSSIVNDRLVPLADTVRECKSEVLKTLSSYEEAVSAFNGRIAVPTLNDVSLSLTGMPIGKNVSPKVSGGNVSGLMSRCAFTSILRNSSYATIIASVYSINGSDSVVEASASWADVDGVQNSLSCDSANGICGRQYRIGPGHSLVLAYVSRKGSRVSSVSTGGYSGSVSIGLKYETASGKTGSLGVLNKSVEV